MKSVVLNIFTITKLAKYKQFHLVYIKKDVGISVYWFLIDLESVWLITMKIGTYD